MNEQPRITDTLCAVIGSYLVKGDGDRFEADGKAALAATLQPFVEKGEPIELVLPGFPFKSLNFHAKTSGPKPDFGEVLALRRLEEMCAALDAVYGHGVRLTIVSDGTTYNDIIGVSDADRQAYNDAVRTLWPSRYFRWATVTDLVGHAGSPQELRTALVEKAALPYADLEAFKTAVQADQGLSAAHDRMCAFLYNDLRPQLADDLDEDAYFAEIREKAYEMMIRGLALNAGVERAFPQAVRLSVHQYDNAGPKFSFGFLPGLAHVSAPWHKVPYRHLDGHFSFVDHARIDAENTLAVYRGDQVWLYQESDAAIDPAIKLSIVKPPQFGLLVELDAPEKVKLLTPRLTRSLSDFFSFICVRGCHFEEREDLVDYCLPFGDIYQWHFGPVHVVQPEEKPKGFVQSLEKTPIHWDLSMLPLDHDRVKQDEWFCADLFMLYCKAPPKKGEGETTLVDGREILRQVGPETVEAWRNTHVTYNTKMTYFGGHPRTYPLVHAHPETGEPILRYQEGSKSEYQTFSQEVQGLSQTDSDAFVEEMNRRIYDPKVCYAHPWEAGDMVIVENYLTLHGRNPMSEASSMRELWRVQTIPDMPVADRSAAE
ncbi:L-tyrosine/L-tryptophan isonitrile synthase family protein [Breoghania sp.]|uniref:isocyanide synthase family protein n=1 Tax=Breoghania sp. TaxID=2065378 RepID=UPI0029C9D387|nr:L-tyrosine/L-tryptophan isonitrile synthase family protein [Breoghania sp.]